MITTKLLKIKCKGCGQIYFSKPKLYYTDREERNLGYEYKHTFKGKQTCKCGEKLEIEIDAFEYPVGFKNTIEENLKNCSILTKDYIEANDITPKKTQSMISDYLDKVADEIPLEIKIKVPTEMFMMLLLTELGYREDKPWTDSEEDVAEMIKLKSIAGRLTDSIMKTIERDGI